MRIRILASIALTLAVLAAAALWTLRTVLPRVRPKTPLERAAVSGSSAAAFSRGGMEGFLRSFSRTATEVDASVSADAQSNTRIVERNVAEVMDMVKNSGGVVVVSTAKGFDPIDCPGGTP